MSRILKVLGYREATHTIGKMLDSGSNLSEPFVNKIVNNWVNKNKDILILPKFNILISTNIIHEIKWINTKYI